MSQKTDLNVTPYYDDFSESDQYHRILFRPGYAVQARELTQLQTIFQNQIERFGKHIFKEGAIVIPGGVTYDHLYYAVKLDSTFTKSSTEYTVADYLSVYVDTIITGTTTGVRARVVGYEVATTTDPDTLYVKWMTAGTDGVTQQFADAETISSESVITGYAVDEASATLQATNAVATGTAASVQEGVFFIRGMFIRAPAQTIVLDKYTNKPSYRVGFQVTETLLAPEIQPDLLDNAQGSSNYAAKGAHRLKLTLTLIKKGLTETDDGDFTELIRVDAGTLRLIVNKTEYSVVEEMLARRTFDESGNYNVTHNNIEPKEHLNDGTNRGIFLSTESPAGDEGKLVYAVGPGKSIINGREYENIDTRYVSTNKARDTGSRNNASVIAALGRWVRVYNAYNIPDVDGSNASVNWFKEVKLYDTPTGVSNRGTTGGGALVGVARSKAFAYETGTIGTNTIAAGGAVYKSYLFDINMYSLVTMSANVSLTDDVVITGSTTGATGIVVAAVSSTTDVILKQVNGTFLIGEAITSSKATDDTTSTTPTLSSILTKNFNRDVKTLFMTQTGGAGKDFSADLYLDQSKALSGQVSNNPGAGAVNTITVTNGGSGYTTVPAVSFTGGGASVSATGTATVVANAVTGVTITNGGQGYTSAPTVVFTGGGGSSAAADATIDGELPVNLNGLNTAFTEELVIGDVVSLPSGAAGAQEERRVTAVTSNTLVTIATAGTNAVSGVTGNRKRGAIQELSKSSFLHTMPKDNIKTVTDVSMTVKRQFVGITDSSGAVTFTIGVSETWPSFTKKNYVLSVMTAGTGGSAVAGEFVDIEGKTTNPTTNTLTITDGTAFANAAEVKLVAPVNVSTAIAKTKTASVMQQKVIDETTVSNDFYGNRNSDKEISLGVADVYKLWAIFDSGSTTVDATPPTLTISSVSGTFTPGEVIIGSTSGAKAYVIVNSPVTTLKYIKISGTFNSLDTITGQTSTYTAAVDSVATGHTDVTAHYNLDSGQRTEYYDIARVTRKAGVIAPSGRLLIVYDYLTHGSGDYFSVDSYGIDYGDIPKFNPELRDVLDFRPRVSDVTVATVNPFSTDSRTYETAGSSVGNLVQADDNIILDYKFYLPRKDILFITDTGDYKILEGVSSENPQYPSQLKNTLLLAKIIINPYTFHDRDLYILKVKNKGYTMEEIGKLETRIKNLEYYTALNLLEQDTQAFQIQDVNGLDRFKNGFVVDNFEFGGSVGNLDHPDYNAAVGQYELYPPYYETQIKLLEENTTDDERKADNYQITGDIVSLPYTHEPLVTQTKASTVELINPFAIANWVGVITWDDGEVYTWARRDYSKHDTRFIEDETLFEKAKADHASDIGRHRSERHGWTRYFYVGAVTAVLESDTKHPDYDPAGEMVDFIPDPWIKSSTLGFIGRGFQPHTKVYPFFDEIPVSQYVKPRAQTAVSTALTADITKTVLTIPVTSTAGFPTSGTVKITDGTNSEEMIYTTFTATSFGVTERGVNDTTARAFSTADVVASNVYGMPLITDGIGSLSAEFTIPEDDTLKFPSGTKLFRLTDDEDNLEGGRLSLSPGDIPTRGTFGTTILDARGRIEFWREVHLRVWRGHFDWHLTRTEAIAPPRYCDPLAQTFLPILADDEGDGVYLTKVDLWFQAKSTSVTVKIPARVEIRYVENGIPTTKRVPGAVAFVDQEDINISDDASVKTEFVFPHPIYVQRSAEYCVVVMTDDPAYKVFIARMGQMDIGGKSMISEQPAAGVLFKSQNAHTWTPSQLEDLTFILYRAKFDTSVTGQFALHNNALDSETSEPEGIVKLDTNQLVTTNASTKVRFKYKRPSIPDTEPHGMYSTSDNVTISGVSSEISPTTLNEAGGLSAIDTTITLTDASNFPAAGGTIKVDDEIITYTGVSTNDLTGCTRGASDGTALTVAAEHLDGETVELYMLAGIPLTEINKTHTAISGIEDDSFLITVNGAYPATSDLIGGGSKVKISRNVIMDELIPFLNLEARADTSLTLKMQATTARAPNGPTTQLPFIRTNLADAVPIANGQPHLFEAPHMVASQINETNEMAGSKSFRMVAEMKTTSDKLSPMIDTRLMMVQTVNNRLNKIESSADIDVGSVYTPSTASSGDNNIGIYITKEVRLASPSTALKVLFAANVPSASELEVLYKILPDGSTENFTDLSWTYFNSTGVDDSLTGSTDNPNEWKDYIYSSGVKDNGSGTALEEYTSFAIKVVMKGTNTSTPPRIKQFRAISLAT